MSGRSRGNEEAEEAKATTGPSAVLWDLDGTLLESKQSIRECMNRVLAEKGRPTFTPAELDQLIGRPLREILATKAPPEEVDAMALRYRVVYNESGWVTVTIHDGLVDLI